MKHSITVLQIGGALLGAMIVDYFATWPYIMTPLYAIPVLIAAYRLPPRGVAGITAMVAIINIASGLLEGTPLDITLLYTSGLLIAAFLAVALARQRQVTARYARIAEQQAQESDLARQRLQQFLAMVAHDLRNPLAALFGALQVLERPELPPLSARQQQVLGLSMSSAASMIRLLDDLRDASRIGTGHFTLRKSQTDLAEIVRRVAELQQPLAPAHRLIIEMPEHLEGMWDGERLNQLLANLISNAVKYSPAGGAVRISACGKPAEACISVADQGIGLDASEMQRLFQPFTRIIHAPDIEGLGLGLYISKAIVEAHGGRIWVESTRGQGSAFKIALPR
jgi:signal transduction histidine kinase